MAAELKIATLGGLAIAYDSAPVEGLASRKAEALLVYLACKPRPHPRDLLAELLWDDLPLTRSRGNLNVLLSSLRQKFGQAVLSDRRMVWLNAETPLWLDVTMLEEGLGRLLPPRAEPLQPPIAAQLETLLDLYQGEFLHGFALRNAASFEQWMLSTQEQLRRMVGSALSALVASHLAHGAYQQGINQAHRLIELDSFLEPAHEQLLRLLAYSGQPATALAHYASYSRLLEQELRASPGPQLTALYQQIKSGTLAPTVAASAAQTAQSAPTYRVADPALRPALRNAPFQPNSFIGRSAELRRITASLGEPACRLLTLLGPGGVGKTRLALAAAALVGASYAEGAVFVPLAGIEHPDLLVDAIAAALGFRFAGSSNPSDQLLASLRNKQILLVLDSFEHLLDGAELLNRLLHAAPNLCLLVTSRELLHLSAEWAFIVPGLDLPPAELTGTALELRTLEEYSALRLFVERARQARLDFTPTLELAPVIAHICQLVEGLPLAIELAASWLRRMSCSEIAAELDRSLSLLNTTLRDIPERQRSIQTVFNHSWNLLTSLEQETLARISVFRGGFAPAAAEMVLGRTSRAGGQVTVTLFQLVDKSLLRQSGEQRYGVHALVRQLAAAKLSPTEAAELQTAHSAYYLGLVQSHEAALYGREPQPALVALRADLDNIRHAWHTAVQHQDAEGIGAGLASLRRYCDYVGLLHEGAALFAASVEAIRPLGHRNDETRRLLARLMLGQGRMLSKLGQYDESNALVAEAAELARVADVPAIEAFARCQWGASLSAQGRRDESDTQCEQALALARAAGEPLAEAEALHTQAVNALHRGEIAHARGLWQTALAIYRAAGDRMWESLVLNNLGVAAYTLGDYTETEEYLAQAQALREAIDDLQGQPYTLNNLGYLSWMRRNYGLAEERFERALALFRLIGDQGGQTIVLGNLGGLALARGHYGVAHPTLKAALELSRAIQDLEREAGVLGSLALLHLHTGVSETAYALAHQALAVTRQAALAPEEARILLILGHILAASARLDEAEAAYNESLRLRRANGEEKSALEPQAGLLRLAVARGDMAGAGTLLEALLPLLEHELAIEDAAGVYRACHEALQALGDPRAAMILERSKELALG